MARNYNVRATCTINQSTTNAPLNITSTATVVPLIYEINSGCVATPANQAVEFGVQRFTALGTAQGAIVAAKVNLPAGTAVVALTLANQGASALPSTASNGVGLMPLQATASILTWVFDVAFEE